MRYKITLEPYYCPNPLSHVCTALRMKMALTRKADEIITSDHIFTFVIYYEAKNHAELEREISTIIRDINKVDFRLHAYDEPSSADSPNRRTEWIIRVTHFKHPGNIHENIWESNGLSHRLTGPAYSIDKQESWRLAGITLSKFDLQTTEDCINWLQENPNRGWAVLLLITEGAVAVSEEFAENLRLCLI